MARSSGFHACTGLWSWIPAVLHASASPYASSVNLASCSLRQKRFTSFIFSLVPKHVYMPHNPTVDT
ncbi:hypothetical protein ACQRIU_006483 [Beauveria bassiana]